MAHASKVVLCLSCSLELYLSIDVLMSDFTNRLTLDFLQGYSLLSSAVFFCKVNLNLLILDNGSLSVLEYPSTAMTSVCSAKN